MSETTKGSEQMRKKPLLIASMMFVSLGTPAIAQAAEVIVHEHGAYAPTPVYRHGTFRMAPRDRLTVRAEGPAVYGWSFRPANCGVFHYWNGDACVDARFVPPPQ
jgi:hypothetical protein